MASPIGDRDRQHLDSVFTLPKRDVDCMILIYEDPVQHIGIDGHMPVTKHTDKSVLLTNIILCKDLVCHLMPNRYAILQWN